MCWTLLEEDSDSVAVTSCRGYFGIELTVDETTDVHLLPMNMFCVILEFIIRIL
jgi:hypothetical protein